MSFDPIYYALLEPTTPDLMELAMMLDPTEEADALILSTLPGMRPWGSSLSALSPQHNHFGVSDMGSPFNDVSHMPQLGEGNDSWSWQ
jgi:hypothetical protein